MAVFAATDSLSSPLSESITLLIQLDNLFEDFENFELMVSDISSPYVVCDPEPDCSVPVTIQQETSDSEL